ncbi:hypothetical protein SAMN02745194_04001 [Roseomonas rosea]|uniref:Universal stress protein family protein n=1 Tax=Muricoccus roseus TaxID=198092 RepID=A0A1M6P5V7_9PROT|nr:universal stress protein [Roseomonas rosea]SHK03324.1 hypothetical protein SAMN02745194_04001 [Roseomonas rosea]
MRDYKALLVHAGLEDTAEARILLAADLADRFDATLIGLAAGSLETTERLDRARDSFHATSRKAARRREWRGSAEPLAGVLAREARAADLLILGLAEAAEGELDALAARAGRAVLLVPERTRVLDARQVLVAWRDTRATRRGIASALPILRLAERVALLPVRDGRPEEEQRRELADMARYLLRHDVPAEVLPDGPVEGHLPGEILDAARRLGADLIIAGNRDAEWLHLAVAEARDVSGQAGACWLLGP